jgi:hypothetical protein
MEVVAEKWKAKFYNLLNLLHLIALTAHSCQTCFIFKSGSKYKEEAIRINTGFIKMFHFDSVFFNVTCT